MRKTTTYAFILFWLGLMVFGSGCAFAPKAGLQPKGEEPRGEKEEVEQVEDFDPLSLNDDDILTPEAKGAAEEVEGERPKIGSETEESERIEQVQGYRVQIFVSSNRENAQKILAEAEQIFPEGVYLKYDAPYYKVRIGNCLTRREADLLQEKAVRHGYRDAWVIRSLVAPGKE
ncbi:MAG: SPOR domain-containing protein [bacterium]